MQQTKYWNCKSFKLSVIHFLTPQSLVHICTSLIKNLDMAAGHCLGLPLPFSKFHIVKPKTKTYSDIVPCKGMPTTCNVLIRREGRLYCFLTSCHCHYDVTYLYGSGLFLACSVCREGKRGLTQAIIQQFCILLLETVNCFVILFNTVGDRWWPLSRLEIREIHPRHPLFSLKVFNRSTS